MSPLTISRTSTVRLLPPRLAGVYQRRNQGPFFVGQVMAVAQALTVMPATSLWSPHDAPRETVLRRDSHSIRAGQPLSLTDSADSL